MNAIKVFIPHLLVLVGGIGALWLGGCGHPDECRLLESVASGVLCSVAVFLLVGVLPLSRYLRAKPTANWRDAAQHADVTIILGFGYELSATGQMQPGAANQALLEWTLANTTAQTLLVQEGVWVAACQSEETTCVIEGRTLRRIHPHDPTHYVNTLATAVMAMDLMVQLGVQTAVLVAHDQQLARAAADFELARQQQAVGRELRFIIPELPAMPYVARSLHPQTRNAGLWRLAELFIARPRDFLSQVPDV
ncbi:MAG: hypothetical protein JW892_00965 [Anaerolineae bacterium]|nr:hypothetical protein [Anaerolineae bacterium]